jgi:hypothetical protein
MQDHNHRHGHCIDVHKRGCALEYDCIGDLNVPRIAVGDDARGTRYRRGRAHEGAQRQRHLFAYRVELAEPHDADDDVGWCNNKQRLSR